MSTTIEQRAGATARESRVVEFLGQVASYPERPPSVECVETHISWVFLTDRFAFKLKKPVRFEFLDFSTLELRHHACDQEVKLNRRLAPDVYLGVVPVTLEPRGRLRLAGSGTPVEWLVKMKRLPADRALDQLIRAGRLTPFDVEQLSEKLADFYQRLPPLTIKTTDYRQNIEQHVRANGAELLEPQHGLPQTQVKRVQSSQLRRLCLASHLFDDRVRDGRIVDGHGDLRPEHIYLAPTTRVIDCIEFNDEFRRVDVLDELCFLSMECDLIGAEHVGQSILDRYRRASGDPAPDALRRFYQCYRACVRAKVCALRYDQVAGELRSEMRRLAASYLRLADVYARSLGPPMVIVVRGLSGTGKSTLAESLAKTLGIELLQTDVLRREILGQSRFEDGFNRGRYCPENRARVYHEMFLRAEKLLGSGLSVILDGTFLSANLRRQALQMAGQQGAVPLVVHCTCDDAVALERMSGRLADGQSPSEAQPEYLRRQKALEEGDPRNIPVCRLDTATGLASLQQQVFTRLSELLFD